MDRMSIAVDGYSIGHSNMRLCTDGFLDAYIWRERIPGSGIWTERGVSAVSWTEATPGSSVWTRRNSPTSPTSS